MRMIQQYISFYIRHRICYNHELCNARSTSPTCAVRTRAYNYVCMGIWCTYTCKCANGCPVISFGWLLPISQTHSPLPGLQPSFCIPYVPGRSRFAGTFVILYMRRRRQEQENTGCNTASSKKTRVLFDATARAAGGRVAPGDRSVGNAAISRHLDQSRCCLVRSLGERVASVAWAVSLLSSRFFTDFSWDFAAAPPVWGAATRGDSWAIFQTLTAEHNRHLCENLSSTTKQVRAQTSKAENTRDLLISRIIRETTLPSFETMVPLNR